MNKYFRNILIALFFTLSISAQDCNLSQEANKYKIRGEGFLELAKNRDDYKLVVDEWEKAIALAPNCAELLYNIAIAYDELGDIEKAISYVKKYSEINQSEDGKKDAMDLLIRLEAKKEKSEYEVKQKLIGKWNYFYYAKGHLSNQVLNSDGYYHASQDDIFFFYENNILKAKVVSDFNSDNYNWKYQIIPVTYKSNILILNYNVLYDNETKYNIEYELSYTNDSRLVGSCYSDFSKKRSSIQHFYFEKE